MNLDVFNNDAFSMIGLTKGINVMPKMYGLIGAMGLFETVTHTTRDFKVTEEHGSINLIPQTATGSAGTRNISDKRKARFFSIGRRRLEDTIKADDVQGLAAFDNDMQLAKVSEIVYKRQLSMKRKHDQTREFLRAGALNGLILDADGSTIYDLYSEFAVARKSIAMDLSNAASNIVDKTLEAKTHIDENLTSSMSTGDVALCSPEFFSKLVSNAKLEKIFENYLSSGAAALNPLLQDGRSGFVWQNTTWVQYSGKATAHNEDGTTVTRKFIPENEAILLPTGTNEIFEENFAPADHVQYVNQDAQEFYSWMEEKAGAIELTTETDVLPIVKNPRVLVTLKAGAS